MGAVEVFHGNSELNKYFSNAVITWEVESFSLIIATERMICSPAISLLGPVETCWKIYLHKPQKKNRLLIKVEMLRNKFPVSMVSLHWAFCFLDEAGNGSFSTERTFSYEPNTVLTLEYLSLKSTLLIAGMNKYNNLILRCRMLVDFGLKIAFPKVRVTGVEHLSNDLCNLPTSFLYHDTTTIVNNIDFSLHRAMLSFRGTKLVRFMEQSTCNARQNFSLSKTKAATAALKYLYTGNLKFILDDPCLTIFDYIDHLEIPEREKVYSPHRIALLTKTELSEHTTFWKVRNFKRYTRDVLGPEFRGESRFQLSLNVAESKDDPPTTSLHVKVKLIESTQTLLILCGEFSFGKDKNHMSYTRKIHGIIGIEENLSVTIQENECPETKELFQNDNLLIKVQVYRSVGDVLTFIVENQQSTTTKISNEKSFMSLSKVLGEIKKTATYSDLTFEVGGQEIKAHKFVVAARSPQMNELFRRHDGLASVVVHGFTEDVFEKFLRYMYIGILAENDGDKLIELYNLGKKYNVDGLLKVVPQVLSKCINEVNMLRILMFADKTEDHGLRKSVFCFVVGKRNRLPNHEDYDMFRSKKPDIYRQIQNIAFMD